MPPLHPLLFLVIGQTRGECRPASLRLEGRGHEKTGGPGNPQEHRPPWTPGRHRAQGRHRCSWSVGPPRRVRCCWLSGPPRRDGPAWRAGCCWRSGPARYAIIFGKKLGGKKRQCTSPPPLQNPLLTPTFIYCYKNTLPQARPELQVRTTLTSFENRHGRRGEQKKNADPRLSRSNPYHRPAQARPARPALATAPTRPPPGHQVSCKRIIRKRVA